MEKLKEAGFEEETEFLAFFKKISCVVKKNTVAPL